MAKRSDDYDLDHTDELPILLETVVLAEDGAPGIDDTAGNTALFFGLAQGEADDYARSAANANSEEIAALEAQLRGIADLNQDLERQIAERDRAIDGLKDTLASLRGAADDAASSERRLATQLALRDARLADLSAAIERLKDEAAASAAEIDRLRAAAEAAPAASGTTSAHSEPAAQTPPREIEELREENAALASYIEGRRRWWNELEAAHSALATKVAALTHELAVATARLAAADALAASESSRATAARAELATYARRVEDLERELRKARDASGVALAVGPPVEPKDTEAAPAALPSIAVEAGLASPAAIASAATPEAAAPTIEPAPSSEAIAQLEAEIAYKRQQVAAQLLELHEREQRLRAAFDELERLRRERETLRVDLDDGRAMIARLEQAIVDKDRAIAARDSRIGTLQDELERRASAVEGLSAKAQSLPQPEPPSENAFELAAGTSAPALLCLTGDAPPRFPLMKDKITVGRGTHCDLQILEHFVSREHARITTSGGVAIIEDLGSRNGVYVNSVRVDRQTLHQGDVIVIGDTQFRFVESMAH